MRAIHDVNGNNGSTNNYRRALYMARRGNVSDTLLYKH